MTGNRVALLNMLLLLNWCFALDISLSKNAVSNSLVAGKEIQLTASAVQGDGSHQFAWLFGDGQTAQGGEVSHTYQRAGTYQIQINAQDGAGSQLAAYYETVYVNEPGGRDAGNWRAHIDAQIGDPQKQNLVAASARGIQFQAGSEVEGARFHWQVIGHDISSWDPNWLWLPSHQLAGEVVTVAMTAIHPDGTAMHEPLTRNIYIYKDTPPPRASLAGPQPGSDGLYRMQMGTPLRFEAEVASAAGQNPVVSWQIDRRCELDGSQCETQPAGSQAEGLSFEFNPSAPGRYYLRAVATGAQGLADPFPPEFTVLVKEGDTAPQTWIYNGSKTLETEETYTLHAGGEDEDMDEFTFEWDLGDGRTATGDEVTVSYPQAGVYRVSVAAVDTSGARDETPFARWIFVNDYSQNTVNNQPVPTIKKPEDLGRAPLQQPFEMKGFGFDADGDELNYYWDFDTGTLGQGLEPPPVAYEIEGKKYVELYVRDAKGFTSIYPDQVSLYIYDGPAPPRGVITSPQPEPDDEGFFSLSYIEINPGDILTFTGTVAGVDDLSGYQAQWKFETFEGAGNTVFFEGFDLGEVVFPQAVLWHAELQVVDPDGIADPVPATLNIQVRENVPPQAYIEEPFWDVAILKNDTVSLAASASDLDGDDLSYEWQLSDGRVFTAARMEAVPFPEPGLYWITLKVRDDFGNETAVPERVYVTVLAEDPEGEYPHLEPKMPQEFAIRGPQMTSITFAAQAQASEGRSIETFFWDFGNGTTFEGVVPPPVTYNTQGNYEVRVFARDSAGVWSPYPLSWAVIIYGDNVPPLSKIAQPPLGTSDDFYLAREVPVLIGEPLPLEAMASDPDGNLPLRLEWYLDGEMISNAVKPEPLIFEEQGVHQLFLGVCDSLSECDPLPSRRFILAVDPALKPESFVIYPDGDITVEPGEELWFYGYGEDPNSLGMSFEWRFEGGEPAQAQGEEVYPVVFNQESPPGEPYVVTFWAKTEFTEDPTPVQLRVTVKKYADSEFEPNNMLTEAKPIGQGTYSSLTLDDTDAADVFSFDVTEAGKDVQFFLDASAEINFRLYHFENGQWVVMDRVPSKIVQDTLVLEDLPVGRYALEIQAGAATKAKRAGLSYSLAINTLQPGLYMPFLVEDGNLSSSIGMLNPHNQPVDLVLTGIDGEGQTVETKTLELAAGQRLYQAARSFFGKTGTVEKARRIRWVKVSSNRRLVGFTNAETGDKSQLMSAAASRSLSAEILVPHIAVNTEAWYTRAVVINGMERQHGLKFSSLAASEDIGQTPSNSQKDFRFRDRFEASVPPWGRFANEDGRATLAGMEIFGRADGERQIASLEMINTRRNNPNFTYTRNDIYISHVAKDTANFWTGLALINPTAAEAGYNLVGYDDEGNEKVRLDGRRIEAGGKLVATVRDLFGDGHGVSWIRVEADAGLAGLELFGDHKSTRLAGFPAATFATDELYFPHVDIRPGKAWTGIALLNISGEDTAVAIEAYGNDGTRLAMVQRVLKPRTKLVATPQALFGGEIENMPIAYVAVKGNRKALTGFELFGSLESATKLGGQLAGLPAQTR